MTRMFNFITKTWNPLVGCTHNCSYCWARRQAKRLKHICELCYKFTPHIHVERLTPPSSKNSLIFVVDMGDLFCGGVQSKHIALILNSISNSKRNIYFFETKNPARYFEFIDKLLNINNIVLSTTIETDIQKVASKYSNAPSIYSRYISMKALHREYPTMKIHISIEPILKFNLNNLLKMIVDINPNFGISIGYDNYNNKLEEPKQKETKKLIENLEALGYKVERKTIFS